MVVVISVALFIAGIMVVVMIHACVIAWTIARFGIFTAAATEDCRNWSKGMSAGDLEKLSFYEYKGGEKGRGSEAVCAVCLDGFQVGERCRMLSMCRHSFHAHCVDSWLMKTALCPICRSRVRESLGSLASDDRRRDLDSGRGEFELQGTGDAAGVPVALHGSAALV